MNKSRQLGIVCATIFSAISNGVSASPILLTDNRVFATASDGSQTSDEYTGTSIPSSDTLITSDGNSSSTANISYTGTTSNATFAHNFTHSINNTFGDMSTSDFAIIWNYDFKFTANIDAAYSIDGFYDMTGPSGIHTFLYAALIDVTGGASTRLFFDATESNHTADVFFTLGDIGDGDNYNETQGSLTGNLIAGHDYSFYFDVGIQTYDPNPENSPQLAATALGSVNLTIESVPIPASVWLFGSGLLGLVGLARRKA